MIARQALRPLQGASHSFARYSSHQAAARIVRTTPTPPKQARFVAPLVVGALVLGGFLLIGRPNHSDHVSRFKSQQDLTDKAPKTFTGGDQGFIKLKVISNKQLSHNSRELTFAFDDPDAVSGLTVASALLAKFKPEDKEKPVVRPYTPTSAVDTRGQLTLVVKQYPGGAMSTHMHGLKEGDTLELKGPLPKYAVTPNKHKHIGMIAGGTGITPMYQALYHILANPSDATKVTLVYANVSEEDILLKKELAQLENMLPSRLKVFYTVDKASEKWQGGTGHITKDLLARVLPKPDAENIKIFVCGPPGLYKAISGGKKSPADQGELTGYLSELGYSKDQVFKF